ncbi:MAG: lipid II flippase MurJ, partial [Paracoccaceae bacterium]|nr:lipid II flippase MurJ [Paracoccaceae bacterium]
RILLASAIMGGFLWGAQIVLAESTGKYVTLAVLVLGGLAVYALAALATGAFRPSDLRAGFARQR